MNINTAVRSSWASARNIARNGYSKAVALGAVGMAASPLAFAAAADPGAAILAEVNTAATTVGGILVVLAGVVGMFILWSYLKRAK